MSTSQNESPASVVRRPEEFWALARQLAHLGTKGVARIEFLRELSETLLDFSRCPVIHMWMTDVDLDYHWHLDNRELSHSGIEPLRLADKADGFSSSSHGLRDSVRSFVSRLHDKERHAFAAPNSFYIRDNTTRSCLHHAIDADRTLFEKLNLLNHPDMLILPLQEGDFLTGLLVLCELRAGQLSDQDCFLYGQLAGTIGRAVINRRAQFRLRERIKELTCLHGIAQVVQKHYDSPVNAMQAIIDLLPAAMQFPAIAVASLTIDDHEYSTRAISESVHRLAVRVNVSGRPRGSLEVSYREAHPEFAVGPFLREERELLISVAHEIAMLIERFESSAAKSALSDQLRHADRLATIGQLAAGVAHELNEPLGNVMGFAQLLQKHSGLPEAAHRDAEQIVQAALHGREIIRKLLLFSRQSDSQRVRLDLGCLIRESLYFWEARCRRSGIELRLELGDNPLIILAVPSEMTQVLVNLAVNAIQAMPTGGVLTIRTRAEHGSIFLTVEDTGHGMDDATQQRIFTPFFTTKDIGEGTGLGLSVVHGIVSAHGGVIQVESAPGHGSRFEIRLPEIASADPS